MYFLFWTKKPLIVALKGRQSLKRMSYQARVATMVWGVCGRGGGHGLISNMVGGLGKDGSYIPFVYCRANGREGSSTLNTFGLLLSTLVVS